MTSLTDTTITRVPPSEPGSDSRPQAKSIEALAGHGMPAPSAEDCAAVWRSAHDSPPLISTPFQSTPTNPVGHLRTSKDSSPSYERTSTSELTEAHRANDLTQSRKDDLLGGIIGMGRGVGVIGAGLGATWALFNAAYFVSNFLAPSSIIQDLSAIAGTGLLAIATICAPLIGLGFGLRDIARGARRSIWATDNNLPAQDPAITALQDALPTLPPVEGATMIQNAFRHRSAQGMDHKVSIAALAFDYAQSMQLKENEFQMCAAIVGHLDRRFRDYNVTEAAQRRLIDLMSRQVTGEELRPLEEIKASIAAILEVAADGRIKERDEFASAVIGFCQNWAPEEAIPILMQTRKIAPSNGPVFNQFEEILVGRIFEITDPKARFEWAKYVSDLPGLSTEARVGLAELVESSLSGLSQSERATANKLIRTLSPNSYAIDERAKGRLRSRSLG